MIQLTRVHDSTLLKNSATYQIDGCLYRYAGSDPEASIKAPKYKFVALPGQKRRADVVLNHRRLLTLVYEVEGMTVRNDATAKDTTVQMSLF